MVSRDLLRDAINVCSTSRGERVGPVAFQRRMRVGYATAAQLLDALESAGVLSAITVGGRRDVLVHDALGAQRLIDEAIEDGRIELDYHQERRLPSLGGEPA